MAQFDADQRMLLVGRQSCMPVHNDRHQSPDFLAAGGHVAGLARLGGGSTRICRPQLRQAILMAFSGDQPVHSTFSRLRGSNPGLLGSHQFHRSGRACHQCSVSIWTSTGVFVCSAVARKTCKAATVVSGGVRKQEKM